MLFWFCFLFCSGAVWALPPLRWSRSPRLGPARAIGFVLSGTLAVSLGLLLGGAVMVLLMATSPDPGSIIH